MLCKRGASGVFSGSAYGSTSVITPDCPGAVSMFSGVLLPSVTERVAEMSIYCAHKKVNIFSTLLLLYS